MHRRGQVSPASSLTTTGAAATFGRPVSVSRANSPICRRKRLLAWLLPAPRHSASWRGSRDRRPISPPWSTNLVDRRLRRARRGDHRAGSLRRGAGRADPAGAAAPASSTSAPQTRSSSSARASGKRLRSPMPSPARMPATASEDDLDPVKRQQPPARRHRRRPGLAHADEPRSQDAARKLPRLCSRGATPRRWPRSIRRSPPKRIPPIRRAHEQARAAIVLTTPDATPAQKLDGDRRACATAATAMRWPSCRSPPPATEASVKAAALGGRRDRAQYARALVDGAERLVRHLARLGAAAGRDRARHHLRRHGRHQHGAWRDGDAGRLHHLRGAAGVCAA